MLPLYAARIEDLGPGDFRQGRLRRLAPGRIADTRGATEGRAEPPAKLLDLKGRLRCRGCGRKGRAAVSVKWRGQGG
jgi:hypothetical protein